MKLILVVQFFTFSATICSCWRLRHRCHLKDKKVNRESTRIADSLLRIAETDAAAHRRHASNQLTDDPVQHDLKRQINFAAALNLYNATIEKTEKTN